MNINLPTKLTITRLFVSVVLFVLMSQYAQRAQSPATWMLDASIVLFLTAAITDFIDGHLARSWDIVTPLGRILDPLADKVLICGSFILLAGPSFVGADGVNVTAVAPWMVLIIVVREMLVTTLRGYCESLGIDFSANLAGKIKMWAQSITVPVILLLVGHGDAWLGSTASHWVKLSLAYITVVATMLSSVQYIAKSRFILTQSVTA